MNLAERLRTVAHWETSPYTDVAIIMREAASALEACERTIKARNRSLAAMHKLCDELEASQF